MTMDGNAMTRTVHLFGALVLAAAMSVAVALPAGAQDPDHCVETGTAEPDDGGGVVGSPGDPGGFTSADHCPDPTASDPDGPDGELADRDGGAEAERGGVAGRDSRACESSGTGGTTGGAVQAPDESLDDAGDDQMPPETSTAYAADAVGLVPSLPAGSTTECRTLGDSGVLAAARIDAGAGGSADRATSMVPTAIGATALALIARRVLRRRRSRV